MFSSDQARVRCRSDSVRYCFEFGIWRFA